MPEHDPCYPAPVPSESSTTPDGPSWPSGVALIEPAGSLRCDGVVGLRSESAEALAHEWEMRAKQLLYESDTMTISRPIEAKEMHADAQVWKQAAEELRQIEAATERQPEPNASVSHEAGNET